MGGLQHNGNRENCNQIPNTVSKTIGQLVKARMFDGASASSGTTNTTGAGQPSKHKWGAVNVVFEEEDDGGETEVNDDGMPTQ